MNARDLMSAPPLVVVPTDPVTRAAAIMRHHELGALPVVNDRTEMRPVGMLTDRDVVVRCVAGDHGRWCTVCDHMTRPPLVTVEPDADVDEVMALMRDHRVRRVMVTEEDRLVGLVTLTDVARAEGPRDPIGTEKTLFRLSEPAHVGAGVCGGGY